MVIVVGLLVKFGLAPSLLSCLTFEITLLGFPMGVTNYFLCCSDNHTTVPSPESKDTYLALFEKDGVNSQGICNSSGHFV